MELAITLQVKRASGVSQPAATARKRFRAEDNWITRRGWKRKRKQIAGGKATPRIDFMFHGSGGSDFCSLQKKKKKKKVGAPAHAYEHQFASS